MWKIFRKKTQEEKELEELSQKIKSEPLNIVNLTYFCIINYQV